MDDLWKYSLSSEQWTWLGGSAKNNFSQVKVNYGTKGELSANNWPLARSIPAVWHLNDAIYLFGGQTPTINSGKIKISQPENFVSYE